MAFKDTGRWQEQLCDTSNHRISGGSSSGLLYIALLHEEAIHQSKLQCANFT